MRNFSNLTLNGNQIQLIPLTHEHSNPLLDASSDGKLWELWHSSVPSSKTIKSYIEEALEEKNENRCIPFVVCLKDTKQIIGSTRFCNIDWINKRLEIGYTWYSKSFQKTLVNKECKFLMLQYAFESLECIAVTFLTNWYNINSRNAILRLGAKQDGVLRNHRINPDGTTRDSVVFSITQQEWPSVKKTLLYKLCNPLTV